MRTQRPSGTRAAAAMPTTGRRRISRVASRRIPSAAGGSRARGASRIAPPYYVLSADRAHRNARSFGLGAPLPGATVGLQLPRVLNGVGDRRGVAGVGGFFRADADIGRQTRAKRTVRGDAEAIAGGAKGLARAGDEPDAQRAIV